MAVLRIVSGENKGATFPLDGERVNIGRENAKITVPDQGVSRNHAEVFRIGEMYFIQDLGSRNGTFLNAGRVSEQEILRVGDRVQVGNTELVFEDRFVRQREAPVLRFGDSIDNPASTVTIRIPSKGHEVKKLDADKGNQQLELLYRVSRHLGTDQDLGEALEKIVKELGEALNADHVYLFAFDENDADNFRTVAAYDRRPSGGELPVSRSILRRVREEGHAVLSSDAMLDDRFSMSESIVMKKIKSLLCAPLMVLNKPIGALYATNSKLSEVFSAEQLALASTIGMLVGNAVEIQEALSRQWRLYRDVLSTLARAAAMRMPETRGRAERVANNAAAIARGYGLTTDQVRLLWIAGMLHNVGAMMLTDAELKNSLNLDNRKAKLAWELLEEIPALADVIPAVRFYNERFDGSGFPEGLKGDAIPVGAEIVGLAHHLDLQLHPTADRPGDKSVKEALLEMRDLAGKKFSTKVVNALLIAYRRNLLFKEDSGIFGAAL